MLLHLPITDTTHAAADLDTPPLSAGTSGPGRIRKFLTGVGRRP
ncbi:hypothetical protein [Nonomuraea jabiensis]